MRWTEADLQRFQAAQVIAGRIAAPLEIPKPAKYGNTRISFQGQTFDSKHELQCWKDFKAQELTCVIRAVIRQVSLPLPGSTRRIRIDFLVVENDETNSWYDAKGYETAAWKSKRDQIFTAYGIKVKLI